MLSCQDSFINLVKYSTLNLARSSNGRTQDFGSCYRGSNPRWAAVRLIPRKARNSLTAIAIRP